MEFSFKFQLFLFIVAIDSVRNIIAQDVQICIESDVRLDDYKEPIKTSAVSFEDLIRGSKMWLDKSLLVKEIAGSHKKLYIITCPPGMGKTINLSLLKTFFSLPTDSEGQLIKLEDSFAHQYFKKGKIAFENGTVKSFNAVFTNGTTFIEGKPLVSGYEEVMNHLGKRPVIYLDFKGFCPDTWFENFTAQVQSAYRAHRYLTTAWENDLTSEYSTDYNRKFAQGRLDHYFRIVNGTELSKEELQTSIPALIRYLHQHHNKQILFLADEYESYIYQLFFDEENGTKRDMQSIDKFFQHFIESTLKGNPFLWKIVLTGVIKVWHATAVDGFNNDTEDFNIIRMRNLSDFYGVDMREFDTMVKKREIDEETREDAIKWYSGYHQLDRPGKNMLSTWSTIHFINKKEVDFYWSESTAPRFTLKLLNYPSVRHTVQNMMIEEVQPYWFTYANIANLDESFFIESRRLFVNKEEGILPDIDQALSYLLMNGYLTCDKVHKTISRLHGDHRIILAIPNEEMKLVLQTNRLTKKMKADR